MILHSSTKDILEEVDVTSGERERVSNSLTGELFCNQIFLYPSLDSRSSYFRQTEKYLNKGGVNKL